MFEENHELTWNTWNTDLREIHKMFLIDVIVYVWIDDTSEPTSAISFHFNSIQASATFNLLP